jgi:hypothetical protein
LQVTKNNVASNTTIAVVANGVSFANPFKHELNPCRSKRSYQTNSISPYGKKSLN